MKLAALPLLILPLLAAGCATPEYRAERALCEATWLRNIPPSYYDTWVEQMRPERRFTGRTTCVTHRNVTRCEHEMGTVFVPYMTLVTVDRHKPERDAEIARCTAEACLARYGNAECK